MTQRLNTLIRRLPTWPLYLVGIGPAALWFWFALNNNLGAEPARALEHQYGVWALQLFILGLAVTPLRDLFGVNLMKFRRAIGLLTFAYVVLHLGVYLLLDQQLYWDAIIKDITKRPYIIIGMVAFLLMIPLAVTSNNVSIRKLGPLVWRRIHWLTYITVAGGAAHFIMLRKTWQAEPLIYAGIISLLLGYRVIKRLPKRVPQQMAS